MLCVCRIPEEECFGVQTQTLKPYQKQCGGNFLNSIIIIIWSFFSLLSLSLSFSLALFQRRLKVESTGVGITCELSSRLSEALLW